MQLHSAHFMLGQSQCRWWDMHLAATGKSITTQPALECNPCTWPQPARPHVRAVGAQKQRQREPGQLLH